MASPDRPQAAAPGPAPTPASAPADQPDTPVWVARLEALRAARADLADPVRWAFIEALARRTRAQQGPARQLLDQRLDTLVTDFAARVDSLAARAAGEGSARRAALVPHQGASPDPGPGPGPGPGPLAALVAALAGEPAPDALQPANAAHAASAASDSPNAPAASRPRQAPAASRAASPSGQPPRPGSSAPRAERRSPPAELKSARLLGGGWARQAAQAQLHRAQATLPSQTGPLNSERLVLAALQRMQTLSPDYLARLLAQVEALRWLARAEAAEPPAPAAPSAPSRGPARGALPPRRRPAAKR